MFNNEEFNNNNIKPLFETDFNSINTYDQTVVQNNNGSFEDVPPKLGPIENLNGIQNIEGPTGDVLSPMNLMPETLKKNNDPLSAYDNGNINLSSSSNPFGNNNINISSPFENDLSYHKVSDLPNTTSFDIPINNVNFDNVLVSKDIDINNYNLPEQNNISNEDKPYTIDNSSLNLEGKSLDTKTGNESPLLDINLNSMLNNEEKTKEIEPEDTGNYEIVQDKTLEEKASIEYEIVQDKEIKEEQESNNLIDLGIDDIYAEEDTIDIVDFEEDAILDDEKEVILNETENQESQPIKMNVEKIKEYILKLKEEGLNVEIEEFDFEHMYQLIVKIDK